MSSVKPVTAAGGVVYDQKGNCDPGVLLIYRRGVWDLPKGKVEEGETIEECAVREVAEEIGVSILPKILQRLGETYHEYEEDGVHYGKTTYWYSMQLPSGREVEFNPERKEGIDKVEWVPLSKALRVVGYDNLVEVLTSLKKTLNSLNS